MKRSLAVLALSVMTVAMIQEAYAGYYTTRCHYRTNRWGDRISTCRRVYVRTHHDGVADAVIVGAAAGAIAGALSTTCAPGAIESNVSATEQTLSRLAQSETFAEADKFNALVNAIENEEDTQKKINAYFSLVGVETTEDMAYFIGARDSEIGDYADILAAKADLSTEQAKIVARELSNSLRGGLR